MAETRRGSFTLQLQEFIERTKLDAETVARSATLSLLNSIVLRSPVDTGRFRGNWQVGTGVRPAGQLAVEDKSGAATIAKGQQALAALNAGETIYIQSNLPYAIPLEYGHSQQAPQGMIRLAIREYRRYIERAIAALPKS